MTRRLFGTDGIRGTANSEPMTPETALKVAMAVGECFHNGAHKHLVVIGKDTRLSGYMLEPALTAGFVTMGMDVVLVGPLPTPAIAMLTRSLRADIGVVLSASHNPYGDNGIKLFGRDGYKLSDELELKIEDHLAKGPSRRAAPAELGRVKRLDDAGGRYIEFVKQSFPRGLRLDGLRIVVDCAHGAGYKVAPTVFWELGAEVFSLGVSPDGLNINRECGALAPEQMRREVLARRADIGIALDGDADRLIVADERGVILDGDQLMALIATGLARNERLSGSALVATVMSNLGLERFLAEPEYRASPHRGRRPLRRGEDARARLQSRRRAVRPYHPRRLCDDRRRLDRGSSGAGLDRRNRPTRERGLPAVHPGAAVDAQRAIWRRATSRIIQQCSERSPAARAGSAPPGGW